MNYLEKRIKMELADNDYELASNVTLVSVEEQIDRTNEYQKELYTVEDWLRDTKQNYPENLIDLSKVEKRLVPYLLKQMNDCYDETGSYPNVEDYGMSLKAEDSPMKNIDLATLIRLLLVMVSR